MPQHSPLDQRAASFASTAARDLAQLRQSLKAQQDATPGNRSLRVPEPKAGRNTIRATRNSPNIFERAGIAAVGGFFGRGLVNSIGLGSGSFYSSSAQSASVWNDILQLGQRVL
jgi:hypothetical protein